MSAKNGLKTPGGPAVWCEGCKRLRDFVIERAGDLVVIR